MKNFTSLWFALLVLSFIDLSLCPDDIHVTVEPGQNVTLTCTAAGNGKVSVVRLIRDDLKPRYVLLYRNGQLDKEQQNPQYKNRTKLLNINSINGKVNLTLSNVTEKDSGVYECRVKTEITSNRRRKRDASEITIIHLSVAPRPRSPGRGHIGLVLGLMVVALVVGGGIVKTAAIVRKNNSFSSSSS